MSTNGHFHPVGSEPIPKDRPSLLRRIFRRPRRDFSGLLGADGEPLTRFERQLRERILSQDMAGFPKEFTEWLPRYLEVHPPRLFVSDLQDGEKVKRVE